MRNNSRLYALQGIDVPAVGVYDGHEDHAEAAAGGNTLMESGARHLRTPTLGTRVREHARQRDGSPCKQRLPQYADKYSRQTLRRGEPKVAATLRTGEPPANDILNCVQSVHDAGALTHVSRHRADARQKKHSSSGGFAIRRPLVVLSTTDGARASRAPRPLRVR